MRSILAAATIVGLLAGVAVSALADQPVVSSTPSSCEPYTVEVFLNGKMRVAVGQACLQPDGSWRLVQDAVVPASPITPAASTPAPGACRERYEDCERSCDVNGILGARHVHADCSVTCDLICGRREGYAPWKKTETPDR